MKKLWLLAVLVLALGAAAISASVASAGNGAVTTKFTATYFALGANWTCQGEHIVGPASNPFVKENEECTLDSLATLPAGTYVGNPYFSTGPLAGYWWNSDFNGAMATSVTLKVTPGGQVVVRASY